MIVIETPDVVSLNTKYGLLSVFKGDDPIGTCLHLYGEWADQEFDVLDKLLTTNSCCVDIGANVGTHTVWLAKRCPQGFIFSFEPQYYIHMLLNSNIIMNNCFNVVPVRSFISNENTYIKTIVNTPKHQKLNYGEFSINHKDESSLISTQVIQFDDFDFFNKKIDFIKMDCEGTEREVLLSAEKTILRDKPHMYVEFNGVEGNDLVLNTIENFEYNCYWHVYPKFNPDNFNKYENNIWVYDYEKCDEDHIPKYFEANMICIHKDNDDGQFNSYDKIKSGDNIVKYVIRHNLLDT